MRRLFPMCMAVSGAAALVYEVAWTRKLTLVFGSTTGAVSICLAAFLGGLATGAYLFGRWTGRMTNPAATYGAMEFGAAAYGAISGTVLSLTGPVYTALSGPITSWPTLGLLFQLVLVGMVLVFPCALMGGTLPVLVAAYRKGERIGARLTPLYSANTLGATIGAAATGFVLLPQLGLQGSLFVAAALNVTAGALALVASRDQRSNELETLPAPAAPPRTRSVRVPRAVPRAPLVWAVVFGCGFSTLFHEVLWTRTLELVLGNSTRAFSIMLSVFLLGLSGGIAASGWLVRRGRASIETLALVHLLIGAATFATTSTFQRLPFWFLDLWARFQGDPTSMAAAQIGLCALVLFLPAFLMGIVFPLAVELAVPSREGATEAVGRLYALNTMGNITGTVLAAGLFIPLVGAYRSLILGAWFNLIFAAVLFASVQAAAFSRRWLTIGAPLAVGLVLTIAVPRWDPKVMTSGAYFNARLLKEAGVDQYRRALGQLQLLFYKEGRGGIVTVTGRD